MATSSTPRRASRTFSGIVKSMRLMTLPPSRRSRGVWTSLFSCPIAPSPTLYARAEDFTALRVVDARQRAKLARACRKARRRRNIGVFLGEITALGLVGEQRAYWDECDEEFVRFWCAQRNIAIEE